jgi:hypothetical protein
LRGSSDLERLWAVMPDWFVREHEPLVRRRSYAVSVQKLSRLLPPQFLDRHAQIVLRLRGQTGDYEGSRWLLDSCLARPLQQRLFATALVLRASLAALELSESRLALAAEIRLWRRGRTRQAGA